MAQEQNTGFALPTPTGTADSAASAPSAAVSVQAAASMPEVADTSARDSLIGGGVLLLLWVAFFFAKNGWANSLVAKRVPPSKANASGWWLWLLLSSLATGVVLGTVNAEKFWTPLIMVPIGALALLGLVLMLLSARK